MARTRMNEEPQTRWETITPAEAKSLLEFSHQQKPKSEQLANRMALEMSEGRFFSRNGENVIIDEDGRLVDGHTRMAAVMRANTPVRFNVTRGVERGLYHTMDKGKPRTVSDILRLKGTMNACLIAGAGRSLNIYLFTGNVPLASGGRVGDIPDHVLAVSEWLDSRFSRTSVPNLVGNQIPFARKIRPSTALALFAIMAHKKGCLFVEDLVSGLVEDRSPRETLGWAVRNAMLRAPDSDRSTDTQGRHVQSLIDLATRGAKTPCKVYRTRPLDVTQSVLGVDFNEMREAVLKSISEAK